MHVCAQASVGLTVHASCVIVMVTPLLNGSAYFPRLVSVMHELHGYNYYFMRHEPLYGLSCSYL